MMSDEIVERNCIRCGNTIPSSRRGSLCSQACEKEVRTIGDRICNIDECDNPIIARLDERTSHFLVRLYCSRECAILARKRFHAARTRKPEPDFPKVGASLFPEWVRFDQYDDPRAIRDHGSPWKLVQPDHNYSILGSTASWAVKPNADKDDW